MNNLLEVCNEINDLLEGFESLDSPPVLIINGRMGGNHVVFNLNLADCIKDNHLVFLAYYKDSEVPDNGRNYYSVALPIELYAGIELHADLPKGLRNEHKAGRIGFKIKK